MVWNGPNPTNAFEDELVSRINVCCGPSQQIDFIEKTIRSAGLSQ